MMPKAFGSKRRCCCYCDDDSKMESRAGGFLYWVTCARRPTCDNGLARMGSGSKVRSSYRLKAPFAEAKRSDKSEMSVNRVEDDSDAHGDSKQGKVRRARSFLFLIKEAPRCQSRLNTYKPQLRDQLSKNRNHGRELNI